MLKIVSIITAGILIAGCSSKEIPTGPRYTVDTIKKSDGYIIKPLQYTSAKLMSGGKSLNTEVTPIIL